MQTWKSSNDRYAAKEFILDKDTFKKDNERNEVIVDNWRLVGVVIQDAVLDEINKVVTKFPMLPQTQQGSLLTLNTNYFERVTNLVVWLVDRKKHVRSKLVSHQLLQNIIKTILKVKKFNNKKKEHLSMILKLNNQ
jgi:hypothetical protein